MTQSRLTVAVSNAFFKSLNKLPNKSRGKVASFLSKFRENPSSPGLNYEHIEGGKDKLIRSVRVDQEIRCIVKAPDEGNVYVLLWVDKHDDAYQWAKRRSCHVNRVSGALQIVDVESAEEAIATSVESKSEKTSFSKSDKVASLFVSCSNEQLMLIGVPEVLIPAVRACNNEESLNMLIEWLPQSCVEGLILLADGCNIEEVINEVVIDSKGKVDISDVATALDRPESMAEFMVITDDDVLEAMLSAPMEQWRVFLHPSQRRLVERDWNGAVRLLGGAGTGKTVVAMHKARWLASKNIRNGNLDRIMFTTFTRNLATDIRNNLTKICSPEELQIIDVQHLDGWVLNFLKGQGLPVRVFDDNAKTACWDMAMAMEDTSLCLDRRFYEEEWKEVVLANGCNSLSDYISVRRIGRGTRLNRQNRVRIWPVFDALKSELRQRGLWEPEEAKQAAAELIKKSDCLQKYQSIIVDEGQDFDISSFKLLRALVGESHQNDLFIVGDPYQRIYGRPVVLGQCDIEIRGRSRKLRINYRTTEETRNWATAVLKGLVFDDLDGGTESNNDYRSLLHGDEPLIKGFDDPGEELKFLVKTIQQINSEQGSLSSTCITARTNKAINKLNLQLKEEGFDTRIINEKESDDPSDHSLRLATMHRVKGLEFDQVFIPGLDDSQMPFRFELEKKPDETSKDLFIQKERSLLHVAATRAKKRVVITYSGKPSSFIRS